MPRKKLVAATGLVLLALFTIGAAASKQFSKSRVKAEVPGFVSLSGGATEDHRAMLVEMAYEVEAFDEFDSITVETQPSGRMLSAHVISNTPAVEARLESYNGAEVHQLRKCD